MSMTEASSQYFDRVAGQWDVLRSGYFGEAVREAAIRLAGLMPEHVVADVGAGTGYLSAGLAPLVARVYALDGSPAMLEIARKNLQGFANVEFRVADGLSLPLPSCSLDAAFANMYLHHCEQPMKAIQEMSRLLRPGGRLVITDMDAHPFKWLKAEMADAWQGFERAQIRQWFQEAGLEDIRIDCTGENCRAESHNPANIAPEQHRVEISTFVAVGTRRSS
jgi:ubiquinone/menaquinone biosynthesis C-methylase UbiE